MRARAAVQNAEGLRHIESLRHLFGLDEPSGNGDGAAEAPSVAPAAHDVTR